MNLRTSARIVRSPRQVPQVRSPNPSKRPMTAQEEALLVAPLSRLLAYVKPRKSTVHTPKNIYVVQEYLQISLVPQVLPLIGDMFGSLPSIKFDDHDLENEDTFPDLAPNLYLERVLYDNVP